ncbi:MAG: 3-phosphoshikimate 1-carboxyvinyltransferase [Vicinamibacterales bacterium]
MSSTGAVTVHPTARVRGRVRPPGDKSISHRYAILAALAEGPTTIHGFSTGADCASTVACLRALGVAIDEGRRDPWGGPTLVVAGRGLGRLERPAVPLDAGNSGSTMRMLAGVLAAHPFETTLDGDASLRRRPMRRVIAPLEAMGARITSTGDRPPITVLGTSAVRPLDFEPDVPSAQVKSAVLFAGLQADGVTRVRERVSTRDHTERGLRAFGARVDRDGDVVSVAGGQRLTGRVVHVPGDISSAAFWLAAGAALPGSDLVLEHVGLNPTRTAILDVLRRLGADVEAEVSHDEAHEPLGSIRVRHRDVGATAIDPSEVPAVIDELPVLAALATHGGELTVSGAQELRVKESDRIAALAAGLRALGGDVDERPDGFRVRGRRRLRGGVADAHGDHRLVMAFAVAALGATGPTTIRDAGAAAVSYPEFFSVLESLCG